MADDVFGFCNNRPKFFVHRRPKYLSKFSTIRCARRACSDFRKENPFLATCD